MRRVVLNKCLGDYIITRARSRGNTQTSASRILSAQPEFDGSTLDFPIPPTFSNDGERDPEDITTCDEM